MKNFNKNALLVIFLKALRFVVGFFILSLPTIGQTASDAMPTGTVGWIYYAGGKTGYVADPVQACRLTAQNHMGTKLTDMKISAGLPDGTSYQCKYPHFLAIAGDQWYGATYFHCEYGYKAKAPGVCVVDAQHLTPATCSIGEKGYTIGNPITVTTGGKFQTEVDLVIGQARTTKISRTYRTFRGFALGQSGGTNWSFSFDRVFAPSLKDHQGIYTQVKGALEDGNYFEFTWSSYDKKYISYFDKSATLEILSGTSDEFLLIQAGKAEHFRKFITAEKTVFLLISSQDLSGAKQTFSYEPDTLRLSEIIDDNNRKINVSWRIDGSVEKIKSEESTVTYQYNVASESFPSLIANATLSSVEYSDNSGRVIASKKYEYENTLNRTHLLTAVIDENGGYYANYAYDEAGRATKSEHGDGADRYIINYPDANTRVVIDPSGTTRTIGLKIVNQIQMTSGVSQPGGSGCNAASSAIAHDYGGNIASQKDFNGNKICYSYESARGLQIAQVSGLSSAATCPGTPDLALKAGTRRTRTAWHSIYPLKTVSSEPGLITKYYYNGDSDSTGRIISCALGMTLPNKKPFPMLCKKTEQATSDTDGGRGLTPAVLGTIRSWDYVYDEDGRLLNSRTPANAVDQKTAIHNYYMETSGSHVVGDLASVTDAMGETMQYLEYSPDGMITQIRGPDGLTINHEYDSRKRLLSTRRQDIHGIEETTSYEYDLTGNVIRVTAPDQSSITLSYDTAHRLVQIGDTAGNSVRFNLDRAGNVVHQEMRGANQEIFTQILRSYDSLNRLQQEKANDEDVGITHQYDPNGNLTGIIDQLGRLTTRQYDIFNRLARVQTPPPRLNESHSITSFGYNNQDRLISVTDPRQLTTTYTLNGFGQQTDTNSPDAGYSSRVFDSDGNLTTSKDARGIVRSYRWGASQHIIQSGATSFDYIPSGSVAAGRLNLIRDESGQTAFTYDGFGRTQTKIQTVNVSGATRTFRLGYTYGTTGVSKGHPTKIIYPSGVQVAIGYGSDSRAANVSITYPGSSVTLPLLREIKYAPSGSVAAWYWGDTRQSSQNNYVRRFDNRGRLLSYPLGNPQLGGSIRTLQYDSVGRISATIHSGNALSKILDQQYDYDNLDRLTGYRSQGTMQTYSYDSGGNRVSTSFGAGSYLNAINSTSNRLTSTTGPEPAKTNVFDSAGNLISDGTTSYTYGESGRMEASVTSGVKTSYRYNGMGQRVAKSTSLDSNFYVYDEEGRLVGEYDNEARVIQETFYLGSIPIAVFTAQPNTETSKIFYVFADHLNSPRVLIRADNGKIVWRWDHADPFGFYSPDEDPSKLGKFVYNMRFPGQFYDKQTNLNYNYYRDYDAQTGRYIQSDPAGLSSGVNTYAYVLGNPVSAVDPFGLWTLGFEAYYGLGGGLSIAYKNGTLEVLGRIGLGIGAGVTIDPFGGPSPHSFKCGRDAIARSSAKAGVGVGVGLGGATAGITAASGNLFKDKVGGGFIEYPVEFGFEKPVFGIRAGASVGIDFGGYFNSKKCECR